MASPIAAYFSDQVLIVQSIDSNVGAGREWSLCAAHIGVIWSDCF